MTLKKGRPDQHLTDSLYMKEEKAGCDLPNVMKTEDRRREISGEEMASKVAEAVESNLPICSHYSSEDTHLLSKPALSYLALIAKVILSSPSQKLNLASIYRTMEEQFPYLRSRGPGWRNSVRHNLSVNDCFVKVSRCEDGRGHYWGINQAHLRDFQQGNFRVYKKARGRRERERETGDKAASRLVWMETFLRRFYESRSSGWEEPQCPLQDPGRYQMCYWDWTQSHYQPWTSNVGWVQSARLRLTDSNSKATAVRGHDSETVTSGPLLCREMNDPVLTGMEESYDSRFMTQPVQTFVLPGCWCFSPVVNEQINPSPYRFYF